MPSNVAIADAAAAVVVTCTGGEAVTVRGAVGGLFGDVRTGRIAGCGWTPRRTFDVRARSRTFTRPRLAAAPYVADSRASARPVCVWAAAPTPGAQAAMLAPRTRSPVATGRTRDETERRRGWLMAGLLPSGRDVPGPSAATLGAPCFFGRHRTPIDPSTSTVSRPGPTRRRRGATRS